MFEIFRKSTTQPLYDLSLLDQIPSSTRKSFKTSKVSLKPSPKTWNRRSTTKTKDLSYSPSESHIDLLRTLEPVIQDLRWSCTGQADDELWRLEGDQNSAFTDKRTTILSSNLDYITKILTKDDGEHLKWAWENPGKESKFIDKCQADLRGSIDYDLTCERKIIVENKFNRELEEQIERLSELTWNLTNPDLTSKQSSNLFKKLKWGKSTKHTDVEWVKDCAERIISMTEAIEDYKERLMYSDTENEEYYDDGYQYDDTQKDKDDAEYMDEDGEYEDEPAREYRSRRSSRYYRDSLSQEQSQQPSRKSGRLRNLLTKRMHSNNVNNSFQQTKPISTINTAPPCNPCTASQPYPSVPYQTHPPTFQTFSQQPPLTSFQTYPPPPMYAPTSNYPSYPTYPIQPPPPPPPPTQSQLVWDYSRGRYFSKPTWSQSFSKAWDSVTQTAADAGELAVATGVLGGLGYGAWKLGQWYFTGSKADSSLK